MSVRRILRGAAVLIGAAVLLSVALLLYARFIELHWIAVRTVRLSAGVPTLRIVHITDIHYAGDQAYLRRAVRIINRLAPDVVCFTGDLVEDRAHLAEALAILRTLEHPVYGVPGNHDRWSRAPEAEIAAAFAATGGAWLADATRESADGRLVISGMVHEWPATIALRPGQKRLLLMHHPSSLVYLKGRHFDAILAGHTHGGQVRLPLLGPVLELALGTRSERLIRGLTPTPSGPLYVNPGLGTFFIPLRFGCRPEITLIEL